MVTVLAVLGVLAVLLALSVVALRDEPLLVEAPRDRPDPAVRDDAPLGPADLERVRFAMTVRGYRMSEVDALLDRLAGELRRRDERIAELEAGHDEGRAADDDGPRPEWREQPGPVTLPE